MRAIEIEAWGLRVLRALRNRSFVEDSVVELKADWPDPRKAARQVGGHANAARGEPILWLVGADEKRGVVGANYDELSSWYSRLKAEFDGIAPSLDNINILLDDATVAALCFDTTRAPYVVKISTFNTPQGGSASLEIPWREGSSTRTARRADLIQMLLPLRRQPKLEPLRGNLSLEENPNIPTGSMLTCHVYMEFYVAPRNDETIVFPYHKMLTTARADDRNEIVFDAPHFQDASVYTSYSLPLGRNQPSVTVNARLEALEITASELILRGPRKISLHAYATVSDGEIRNSPQARFTISFVSADDDLSCRLFAQFRRNPDHQSKNLIWKMELATV